MRPQAHLLGDAGEHARTISSSSWKASTTSDQPSRASIGCEPTAVDTPPQPKQRREDAPFAAGQQAHAASNRPSSSGVGSPCSRRSARTRSASASALAIACSRVGPYAIVPGKAVTSASQRPSSSRSVSTLNPPAFGHPQRSSLHAACQLSRSSVISALPPGWVTAPFSAGPTVWAYFHSVPEVYGRARLPAPGAVRELGRGELDVERAGLGVDVDDVAVLEQADRAADRRLGADMADAEAARGAREAAVGDQRHLVAHALAVDAPRSRPASRACRGRPSGPRSGSPAPRPRW